MVGNVEVEGEVVRVVAGGDLKEAVLADRTFIPHHVRPLALLLVTNHLQDEGFLSLSKKRGSLL